MKLHIANIKDTPDSASNASNHDIRQRILSAAGRRFSHYGYDKTTVQEIAEDCGMSSGNLYRYFSSKLDIAVAMTRFVAERAIADLHPLLTCLHRSEEQRLVDCVFRILRNTYNILENTPHMVAMARMAVAKSSDTAASLQEQECAIYERILMSGKAKGEFKFAASPADMAKNLQVALWKFRFSQMASGDSLKDLEIQLAGVMQMILGGFKNQQHIAIMPEATAAETLSTLKINAGIGT